VKDGKSELTMKTFPDENKTNNSTKPAKKKSSGKKNKKTSVKKMMIRGYYPFKTRKSTFSLSGIHSSKQVDPPKPPNPPPPPLGKVRK